MKVFIHLKAIIHQNRDQIVYAVKMKGLLTLPVPVPEEERKLT